MGKKVLAVFLLVFTLLSLCSCESEIERAECKLRESEKQAEEARKNAVDAWKELRTLETILGR